MPTESGCARIVCSLVALTTLGFASGARGQAPPAGQTPKGVPTVSERVEVVATRLPEAPHDVPAPVEVLTGEDLRSIGATTLRAGRSGVSAPHAGVAELADAPGLGPGARNGLGVRVPPPALKVWN